MLGTNTRSEMRSTIFFLVNERRSCDEELLRRGMELKKIVSAEGIEIHQLTWIHNLQSDR